MDAPSAGRAMRAGKLVARVVRARDLTPADRDAMWRLFDSHYAEVTRSTFEGDLSEKSHVIVARDAGDGSLQGFSTLTRYRRVVDGRPILAIFSGDTIVASPYWGQPALQSAFGRYITATKLAHPFTPVYWFLISKGYKTYLLLTRNFPEHWPRATRATPSWERALIDALARERFGAAWDPAAGVVRAHTGSGRLREGVAPIDDGVLASDDARFFHRANPRHASGDELACVGRVDATILVRYLAKQLRRRRRRAKEQPSWAPH